MWPARKDRPIVGGSLGLTDTTGVALVEISGVRVYIRAKRHEMAEAVRIVIDAIVKDGDKINKFLWKAGVGTVATAVLLWVLIARYGGDSRQSLDIMRGHVTDTQTVILKQSEISNRLAELNGIMRIQSNLLAQSCSNLAGASEEKRDRCFDVLNGRAPQ